MPDAAITTDIIVGFPGETEDDFKQTMYAAAQARFAGAFTFQYSIRPGTPAADLPDQVPADVVQERYERLVALVEEISWDENKKQVGKEIEVLVSTGEGRKDDATKRISGRACDNRLVHLAPCDAQPGDFVTTTVTRAAPHHLLADDRAIAIRHRGPATQTSVLIGMPALP
jgi:tRNA-2-methylthio-N6-dimethylallyladenosine synthase